MYDLLTRRMSIFGKDVNSRKTYRGNSIPKVVAIATDGTSRSCTTYGVLAASRQALAEGGEVDFQRKENEWGCIE